MPKVSVIIPNYNHASFLKQRIDSILNQTFKDFELIILDDCSIDSSKEIIEQYGNHPQIENIIYNETNSGSTFKQWKKGIELAKGDYVWFAESDDYADLQFLEKLVPIFDKGDNVGLVFCNSMIIDEDGKQLGSTNNWTQAYSTQQRSDRLTFFNGKQFCNDHLFLLNRIPNASAVLFKRKLVTDNLDWIDIRLKNSGDWKLWLNIAMHANIIWLNEDLNYFRKHKDNVTNSLTLLKTEALSILKEFINDGHTKKSYKIYESICFWSFNSAAWTNDAKYTRKNFWHYFRNNISILSIFFVGYFLIKQTTLFLKKL